MKENDRIYLELDGESDRASAVLCAAFLDYELEILLRRFLREEKETDELFQQTQPLSSFGSRAKFAYVLGLISEDVYHDLNLIRKIRNDFAHDRKAKTFGDPKIASRCSSLKLPNLIEYNAPKSPRERFEHATKIALGAVSMFQMLAYAERRETRGESGKGLEESKFSSQDVSISTWFYKNEKLAGVTITYADRRPISISWDNHETLLRLANELRILANWLMPEAEDDAYEPDAG